MNQVCFAQRFLNTKEGARAKEEFLEQLRNSKHHPKPENTLDILERISMQKLLIQDALNAHDADDTVVLTKARQWQLDSLTI